MTPTILVAGATGNTGRSVVETLSKQLNTNDALRDHKILALTRSSSGAAAQKLAQLPGVEVLEKNWVDITDDWLRQHEVARAFIASHNQPNQFPEESAFHLAALQAGVEYVVRISTTAANVRPDFPAYYPRQHWAIESLLGSPEFDALKWTSLQPNIFTSFYLAPAVNLVKEWRQTGKQGPLRLVAAKDAPVGIIDADDVGVFAAHLLLERDPTKHNKAKYVLNGPEDITGEQVVKMVEAQIGQAVADVRYKDLTFIDEMAAQVPDDAKQTILTIKHAPKTAWDGQCSTSTTSKEVLDIAPPKATPAKVFQQMLDL